MVTVPRMGSHRVPWAASLAAASGALLTACAASPQPQALAPVAAAARAPVTPSPTTAADAETAAGASAFATRYFQRLNVAYQTRDVRPLAGMTEPGCRSCRNFADDIAAMIAAGHTLVGDSFQVVAADAPPVEGHLAVVDLLFRSPGCVEYTSTGAVLLHRRATSGQVYLVTTVFAAGRWRIREVALP